MPHRARFRVPRRLGRRTLLGALAAVAVVAGVLPSAGAQASSPPAATASLQIQGGARAIPDTDARPRVGRPTAAQRAAVARLGAQARWNAFGTPQTLLRRGGALASGLSGDPASAARAWLLANRGLFRLSAASVANLELVRDARIGAGHALTFRQRFGPQRLPATTDGLVILGIVGGKLVYVASSIAPDAAAVPAPARLSAADAVRVAAGNVGRGAASAKVTGARRGWTTVSIPTVATAEARLVAVPMPAGGARTAWETYLQDTRGAQPLAESHWIDAQTGQVLLRHSRVDDAAADSATDATAAAPDPAQWQAFTASPPLSYASTDTRQLWCWQASSPSCQRILDNAASHHVPWDVDPASGTSTNTTNGNNAIAVQNWNNANPFSVGTETATPRPDRHYTYAWTNQWFTQKCSPDTFTSPQANDIDAARANLFAMHNRMHDFAYFLGFTEQSFNLQQVNFGLGGAEGDHEQGNAQAGGIVGGPPQFAARDNANQITPADGTPPITNMYLWQPIAGSFYAPCVDGDFDMSVIGHEYTHAISNRMVAGANAGLSGFQSGSMGESWSDLDAEEYLHEYGYVPVDGEDSWAVGPYVTNDRQRGIRNYALDRNPLNYSDLGYDLTGPEVHADGEVWNAINFAVRTELALKYALKFPPGNRALQQACADGKLPADQCPGNRRWIQLVYDAWLLLPSRITMVDARDAMLAADQMRFGGANQAVLWDAFARTGIGRDAHSTDTTDSDPTPSFASPMEANGTVTFRPVDEHGQPVSGAQLFIGDYEARVTPVADTDPATPLGSSFQAVPGVYHAIARANGRGAERLTLIVPPASVPLVVRMPKNLASAANGASASGDGVNQGALIDDTEATDWASLNSPVAGKQVTVHLDPSAPSQVFSRIQVSALVHPANPSDPNDPGTQSRFSALRQFQLQACLVTATVTCSSDADFHTVFTSPADAFPSVAPRPRAPELIMRSFRVPPTRATFVRLVVLSNQCTGAPAYAGEQDNDPRASTDCATASAQATIVRAAELQVFAS